MSFAPQFQPPRGVGFDASAGAGQPLHANIFQPPPSPSASSYNLGKSTGSLFSDISMSTAHQTGTAKRKRRSTRDSTPLDWHMNMDGAHEARDEERTREFRYTLAGQISTTPAAPPAGAESGLLEDSVYSDVDYRRALGPKPAAAVESPSLEATPSRTTAAPTLTAWSLFSLQAIGDVVGKVWEFCRKGAFRGFQAGGGQAYDSNGSTVTETTGKPSAPEPETPMQAADDTPMAQDPPVYYSETQTPSSPIYHDLSTSESTPLPAAKRRQVSANNDELRNWVVVDEPSEQPPKRFAAEVRAAAAARPSGLVRPRSGYYSQASASSHRRLSAPSQRFTGGLPALSRGATRPSLRIPHAASPSTVPREPASFASPRASPISRSTTSRIPVAVPSPVQQSYNPNPFAVPTPTAPGTPSATLKTTAASRPSSRQSLPLPTRSPTARHSLGAPSSKSLRPSSPSKLGHAHHRRNQPSASSITSTASASAPGTGTTTGAAHSRRHSTVPRRPEDIEATSPRLDAEARQLAQRRLAAERDADAKVDAFNARLLSMIRQGREALGTKVEVEMDMDTDMGEGIGGGRRVASMGSEATGWEDDD